MSQKRYLEVITAPVTLPVTLDEVKEFLRITHTKEDSLLTALIQAVAESAEKYTNRLLSSGTYRLNVSGDSTCVELFASPVTSISSVEVYSQADEAFTPTTDFTYTPSNGYPVISLFNAPELVTGQPFTTRITYVAGYSVTPPALKHGLLIHVSFLYENRGDVESIGSLAMPLEAKLIYRQFRHVGTYA